MDDLTTVGIEMLTGPHRIVTAARLTLFMEANHNPEIRAAVSQTRIFCAASPSTTPPTPARRCGLSSTPPSLIASRAGMVTGSIGPGLPSRARLDHDVAAGNDDAAHLEDFHRLLNRWSG